MRSLNFVKMLFVSVCITLLSSCGDDITYYTIQNTDEGLCAHTWMEEYDMTNEEGIAVRCVHQLKFTATDHSGQEIHQYYYTGETRPYREVTRNFDWQWMDDSKEGLRLNFGAGSIIYFENVWVREHYISGKLNGKDVTLTDANYQ